MLSGVAVQGDADGLPAGGGPGRLLRRAAAAAKAPRSTGRGGGRAGRADHPRRPGRRGRDLGGRLQLHRRRGPVQQRLLRRHAEAVRGAHRPRRQSAGDHRPAAAAAGGAAGGRIVIAFNLPPIIGLGTTGGFQYPCSRRCRAAAPADLAAAPARPDRRGQPAARARGRVQHLRRRHAAALSSISTATRRRRWASRSPTSSTRCRRRSAATMSTTSTCSAAPGRSTSRPRRHSASGSTTSTASMCSSDQGEMVPISALASVRLVLGPQTLIRYNGFRQRHHQRRAGPGLQLGRRASPPWSGSPTSTLPAGYGYEWTGTALQENAGLGQDHDRARARRAVRLSSSWWRSTRAGISRSRCCSRSSSA